MLPQDAVYIGPYFHRHLYAGHFRDGFPGMLFELDEVGGLHTDTWSAFRTSHEGAIQRVDEKLGLMTEDARRAWVAGRILRDEKQKRLGVTLNVPIETDEWSELSGLTMYQLQKSFSILERMGRASASEKGLHVWGPSVTPLEMVNL